MGDAADLDDAVAALMEAAAHHHVVLTEHTVAVSRAESASRRLDDFMDSLKGTGVLKEFARGYRMRRIAATERGEGFMSYGAALVRLRLALVPLLMAGGQPVLGQSLFAQVFRS